jgi:electron transfer flavoprotein beta subunit
MPLKILVAVKRVEDFESLIRVKPDGTGIVTEGVKYVVNPFDEIAVEEALRLRERHQGQVVVTSIGGAACLAEIRTALATGADRGVHVAHDGPLDPGVVSTLLARLVAQEQPDLVILGKQAIDDDQNQTGQLLAEKLGWGQATNATKKESLESEAEQKRQPGLALSGDGARLRVMREVDGGVETLELLLPAVVTVDLRLNRPRFASLPNILRAKKAQVPSIPAASLAGELGPTVVVKRLVAPPRRQGGAKVADVAELWTKLHAEAKVL